MIFVSLDLNPNLVAWKRDFQNQLRPWYAEYDRYISDRELKLKNEYEWAKCKAQMQTCTDFTCSGKAFTGDFDYPTLEGQPDVCAPYIPGPYFSYAMEEEDD